MNRKAERPPDLYQAAYNREESARKDAEQRRFPSSPETRRGILRAIAAVNAKYSRPFVYAEVAEELADAAAAAIAAYIPRRNRPSPAI